MPHIFISYAKKDSRALAEELFDTINAMDGFTAWMDKSLEVAESWALQIQDEIDKADLVIVLLSPDVNRRPTATIRRSFVLNEIDYIQQENKQILPVMAQQTKMPVQIAGLEYIDLARNRREGMRRILALVQELSPQPAAPSTAPAAVSHGAMPSPKASNSPMLIGFVLLLVLAISAFIFIPPLFNNLGGLSAPTEKASATRVVINLNQTNTAAAPLRPSPSDAPSVTASPTTTPTDSPSPTPSPTITPSDTPSPTMSLTPDLNTDAIFRAQNFVGTRNSEWAVHTNTFADNVEMALVPKGCFTMGSTENQAQYAINILAADVGWPSREQPATSYCIPNAFWIDVNEVSQVDFARLGGTKARQNNFVGVDLPVETITWLEAQAYCEAQDKRLPNEAEWEYAARGVESLIFPWGNDFDGNRINYCDAGCGLELQDSSINDGYRNTAPVGSYSSGTSWIGAVDMSGNVWEWTSSRYRSYPYNPTDGREEDTGSVTDFGRVIRGGSWDDYSWLVRSSVRSWNDTTDYFDYLGFRCVRDID